MHAYIYIYKQVYHFSTYHWSQPKNLHHIISANINLLIYLACLYAIFFKPTFNSLSKYHLILVKSSSHPFTPIFFFREDMHSFIAWIRSWLFILSSLYSSLKSLFDNTICVSAERNAKAIAVCSDWFWISCINKYTWKITEIFQKFFIVWSFDKQHYNISVLFQFSKILSSN